MNEPCTCDEIDKLRRARYRQAKDAPIDRVVEAFINRLRENCRHDFEGHRWERLHDYLIYRYSR